MSFLFPLGLLALIALPIVLILHLLRERRRRVAVPSLLLWEHLPRRQDGQRSRRLPLTLLLLLHLLIAALVGLALGAPQLPGPITTGATHTALVVDTSSSMATLEGTQTRFEAASQQARALLAAAGPGDRLTLIAAGPRAQIVASSENPALIDAALSQLQPAGVGTALDEALTLAEAALDPELRRRIVVVSDGALPPSAPREVGVPVEWVQVGRPLANRAVIAFSARPWGSRLQVYARAANYDGAPFFGALRLYADDALVATERVGIEPRGETELTWTLPAGAQSLRAELEGGDALPDDDDAFLSVTRGRPIDALLVSDQPDVLRRALGVVAGVTVRVVTPADYEGAPADMRTADLTVLDGYLPAAWPEGATLVVNPPSGSALLDVGATSAMVDRAAGLQQSGTVLSGIELGGVVFANAQVVTPPPWAEVQLAAGDLPLILRGSDEGREIAVWSFDLRGSSLPARIGFPLLVSRTVRDLAPPPLPAALRLGEPLTLRPGPHAEALIVSGPDDLRLELPAAGLSLETLREPGLYRVEERRASGDALVGLVGLNAGAALESNLDPQPPPTFRAPTDDAGGAPAQQMTDLWPWLVLGALGVLAIEWTYALRPRGAT